MCPKSSVLFLVPYPQNFAPGQRFRFEHYLDVMEKQGVKYKIHPFLNRNSYKQIYSAGIIQKLLIYLSFALKRLVHLWDAQAFDYIYIYREAFPVGPPWIEWILSKVFRKPIIYDFDDAIWMSDPNESWWISKLKWKSKVSLICRWGYMITCGNEFLAGFARQYNTEVKVIPTVVDTEYHTPEKKGGQKKCQIIGWTGSHSTLVYLERIMPVLRSLSKKINFKLHIIGNRDPKYTDSFVQFIPWSLEDEISRLNEFDIGIMPLFDEPWSQGKCGFKLIQYGAMGIPSIADNVGVNDKVIKNGKTGIVCRDLEEWREAFLTLLQNKELRTEMGQAARNRIVEHYSVAATTKDFLELFR